MRPHAKNANRALLLEYFVNKPMLNIDSPRISSFEIAYKLFVWRWILKRIDSKHLKQLLGFNLQACSGKFFSVLKRVLCENNRPTHHLSSLALLASGSAIPFLMDSRMPGTDKR